MRSPEEIKRIHDLWNKEIAKYLRADLKEAYPDFKFSITSDSNTIRAYIIQGPIDFYTKEYMEAVKLENWELANELRDRQNIHQWIYTYNTEIWYNTIKDIEKMLDVYNHDNSDIMTDYFDKNYYSFLEIWKWDKEYVNTSL